MLPIFILKVVAVVACLIILRRQRGRRSAVASPPVRALDLCVIGLAFCVTTTVIRMMFGADIDYLYASSIINFLATIAIWAVILRVRGKCRITGPVVRSLGRPMANHIFFLFGFIAIWLGISSVWTAIMSVHFGWPYLWFSPLMDFSFAVAVFKYARSSMEIREAGFYHFGDLLRWSDIRSYQWGGKTGRLLLMDRADPPLQRWWLPKLKWGVVTSEKEPIDGLLKARMSPPESD